MEIMQFRDFAVPAASIIGSVLATLTTLKSAGGARARLKADIDMLGKLDKDSEAYKILATHIDWRMGQFTMYESERSRINMTVYFTAIGLLVFTVYMIAKSFGRELEALGFFVLLAALILNAAIQAKRHYRRS